MNKKRYLRKRLQKIKKRLQAENHFIKPELKYLDNLTDMIIYRNAFQDAIEEVYSGEKWWEVTNRWDIFCNSIYKRKTVDEIIEDILNHVKKD